MTLEQRLTAVFTQIGDDIQLLLEQNGDLTALNTTAKTNLVAAINEILTIANSATGVINDSAGAGVTNKTYSVDKILTLLDSFKQDILGGVPASAFDTIKEIADYIASDQTLGTQLVDALGKRVRFDAQQSLSAAEKLQARENIDAFGSVELGNPDTDYAGIYNTAKTT